MEDVRVFSAARRSSLSGKLLHGVHDLEAGQSINGARMRFDEVHEAGGIHGREICLIVEDHGYQEPRAIQAANKLLHRDKVFAVFFSLGKQINNTVLSSQMETGIPNLFPYTGARSMNEPFRRLQFTQRGVYYDEIREGFNYSMSTLEKNHLASSIRTPTMLFS